MPIYKIEVTRLVEYKATVQIERPDKQAAWTEVRARIERYPELVDFEVASTAITLDAVRQLDEAQMTEHERYEAAIDRADIVAVLRRYAPLYPPLHPPPLGEKWYRCSCPITKEADELTNISVSRHSFMCSCCGFDGNAIDIIQRREGLSFLDALARLEQFIKEDDLDVEEE
jgi:CHC2 zinc finger